MTNSKLINLTPHTVNILLESSKVINIQPSGVAPRIEQENHLLGVEICGVPVSKAVYGKTQNLPEEQNGVCYIVSKMVVDANPSRGDLFYPNDIVRDEKGRIIGCKSITNLTGVTARDNNNLTKITEKNNTNLAWLNENETNALNSQGNSSLIRDLIKLTNKLVDEVNKPKED